MNLLKLFFHGTAYHNPYQPYSVESSEPSFLYVRVWLFCNDLLASLYHAVNQRVNTHVSSLLAVPPTTPSCLSRNKAESFAEMRMDVKSVKQSGVGQKEKNVAR